MISDALGARVVAVDIQSEALSLARSIGAAHVVNAREEPNIIECIKDVTAGGAHVSIDALGSIETCRNSILCLRKRGRHVQVGLMVADYKDALVPMNLVIANELEILGSHGMQAHQYAPMMEMILAGKLKPARLVNRRVTLDEAPAILESMGQFKEIGVTVIDRI
jgi:alcohol dehydrogenase